MQNGLDKTLYQKFKIDNWQHLSEIAYDYFKLLDSFTFVNGFTYGINHLDFLNKVPEFKILFDTLDITCTYAAFIVMNSKTEQHIHRDKGKQIARLLWPIANCLDTFVYFYEVYEDKKQLHYNNSATWTSYDLTTSKKIDHYELDQPLFVNTTIPHYVHLNPLLADRERISLYFMFDTDPTNLIYNREKL